MPGTIRVGTASWADPGFIADWYPRKLPASERLPYYTEHFNLVELNSSFYAIPARKMVERWCYQTPADFIFDVKLYRLLSRHATPIATLPPVLRERAETRDGKVILTPELEERTARYFLEEIHPFAEAGKMGSLLLQMSPSFDPHTHRLQDLDNLLGLLREHSVSIELRNRNWMSDRRRDETIGYFKERKITFVSVDVPTGDHFTLMPKLDPITNPNLSYFRLHGRSAQNFVTGKSVAERFDYQYSEEELREIIERAIKLAEETTKTHVLFNNNSSDYALRAAARFREILDQEYAKYVTAKSQSRRAVQPTFLFD